MPSRRDSLRKLDAKLKALAKSLPEGKELFDVLFDLVEIDPHSTKLGDRAAATISGSFLEHALERAIVTHLPNDISLPDKKELFESENGPLGTFHKKIVFFG